MIDLCQCLVDGKGMPDEWKTSVIMPTFKIKSDVMSCGSHRRVKLLKRYLRGKYEH